jgi:C1A family cysteine protease
MPHPHETLFTYDNSLVASCATSPLAALISRQGGGGHHHHGSTSDCLTLLQQHASHYNRPAFSSNEHRFWDELLGHNKDVVATQTLQDLSTRHETFLHSVMFVHRHNTDETMNHQVALNRFSDVPMSEFPKLSSQQQHSTHSPLVINFNDPMFVRLNNEEIIMDIGAKIRREQRVVVDSTSSFLENIIESIKDSWWWIGGGQLSSSSSSSSPHIKTPKKTRQDDNKDSSFLLDKQSELGGLETNNHQNNNNGSGGEDTTDPYKTYLNWATTDNPDGVAVVHPPIDQGICGSCWAISALGTMESSIARNMAYIGYETAYNEAVKKSFTKSYTTTKRYLGQKDDHDEEEKKKGDDASVSKGGDTLEDLRTLAILAAQQVERKSIDIADLSVQELIDCDMNNQGCAGGNQLLSFYFLHKYGVTSTKNYPYVGTQNVCNRHKVSQPIATVETWGILTADHENNLEKVIRYIGPVAVGLGAYDPSFVSYSGGVFTSNEGSRCNHLVADHAMLIVGYGEEVARNGTKLKVRIQFCGLVDVSFFLFGT